METFSALLILHKTTDRLGILFFELRKDEPKEIGMRLNKEQKEKLKEIIKDVNCSYGFKCLKKNLKDLPEVERVGSTDIFECRDPKAQACPFALSFGYSYFCQCPARLHLKKEFDI